VREVLHRPLYRGEVIYNKTRKRDERGQTAVSARPEAEWLRIDWPELRIVSEEAWNAAHARLSRIRTLLVTASGRPLGGRRRDVDSQYWLSGFAR
jgi:site-specific DNA recombinase